jgi:DNA primase
VARAPTLSTFLLAELRAQSDLDTPEGRSGFLIAAKPHVQKIAATALKLQVVKEVARLGGVTQEEAERILELRSAAAPVYRNTAPARRTNPPPSSPEWKLLSYVVARPALAPEVDLALLDPSLPETQALRALAEQGGGAAGSGGMLVEQFQNGPHAQMLFDAQANAMDVAETEEHARQQIRHALWKLEINRKNRLIQALGEKLRAGKLSKEEHHEYGRMITEVKALEHRLQADGRVPGH